MTLLLKSHKLPNYLRTYRKRAGFSQAEVAFLLGCQNGSKVSRYERGARQPALLTILACEALFRASGHELFAGLYDDVERHVRRRAGRLERKIMRSQASRLSARKLAALAVVKDRARSRHA